MLPSDRQPTYHLSVVADDIDMAITHVVRGDDHISNTPKQVLLYQAFGQPVPAFAHVPLILGTDKKRLSKRHGATSVMEYQRLGYLPEAMVNFLALLGWSPGDDQELFTRDELIAAFALEGISGGNAVFNPEKLDWFNQQHIMRLPAEDLGARLEPLARRRTLERRIRRERRAWFLPSSTCSSRASSGSPGSSRRRAVPFVRRSLSTKRGQEAPRRRSSRTAAGLATAFDALEPFEQPPLEACAASGRGAHAVKPAALIHATRVAVTGRAASPGLFEVLELLGRERCRAAWIRRWPPVASRHGVEPFPHESLDVSGRGNFVLTTVGAVLSNVLA